MHDPSLTDQAPSEEYLTLDEVAKQLKVSKKTVRRWLDRGDLPFIKIAGTIRVPASKLREVLATREESG